jgi:hypothetical protein
VEKSGCSGMTGNENRRITRQKARLYHKNKTKPRKKKKKEQKWLEACLKLSYRVLI